MNGAIDFQHSGNVGDIFYGLSKCATYDKVNLYLVISELMPIKLATSAIKLIETQPYIDKVEIYTEQHIDVSLDSFRHFCMDLSQMPLAYAHLNLLNRFWNLANPWVHCNEKDEQYPIIINQTERYYGYVDYLGIINTFGEDNIGFIGTETEYNKFCDDYKKVNYVETKDFLEVAKVIKGSKIFIGNQSSPYAIAEGMKHPRLQSSCEEAPNCIPIGYGGHSSWEQKDIEIVEYYLKGA